MSRQEVMDDLGTPQPEYFVTVDGRHCCVSRQAYTHGDCGPVVVERILVNQRSNQKKAMQLAVFYLN